jgi:hypothetical protein
MLLVLAAIGCSATSEQVCQSVGRDGALVHSADRVVTIAISPEALDETVEICVGPSDAPPMVAGPAYRVKPDVPLHFAATVTYRAVLPSDVDMINIGRIDAEDFAQGKGQWRSHGGCRV